MKSVRENTQELLTQLLRDKGGLQADRAAHMAGGLITMMGLQGPKGDLEGPAQSVMLYNREGVTSLFARPIGVPIVWVMCDDLNSEGLDAVEVI
jgi:hypothetical protein